MTAAATRDTGTDMRTGRLRPVATTNIKRQRRFEKLQHARSYQYIVIERSLIAEFQQKYMMRQIPMSDSRLRNCYVHEKVQKSTVDSDH